MSKQHDESNVLMDFLSDGIGNNTTDINKLEVIEKNWKILWQGMPSYQSENLEAPMKLVVKFKTLDDLEELKSRLGIKLTNKTKSTFYPPVEKFKIMSMRWVDEAYLDEQPFEEEFEDDK